MKEKSELSFFLLLLKEKSNMNRFQVKRNMYCTHILSSNLTIYLLISFVSFVLSIYVYVMPVCKKQINEIKKGVQIRISFFIFSPSLTSSLMVYAVKKTV